MFGTIVIIVHWISALMAAGDLLAIGAYSSRIADFTSIPGSAIQDTSTSNFGLCNTRAIGPSKAPLLAIDGLARNDSSFRNAVKSLGGVGYNTLAKCLRLALGWKLKSTVSACGSLSVSHRFTINAMGGGDFQDACSSRFPIPQKSLFRFIWGNIGNVELSAAFEPILSLPSKGLCDFLWCMSRVLFGASSGLCWSLIIHAASGAELPGGSTFWTSEVLAYAVAGISLLALLLWGWTAVLRRHLKNQAAEAAEKISIQSEYSAVLAERNRLAGELHDGVQQLVSGLSMHLEAARHAFPAEKDDGAHSLNTARQLVVRLRDELRRCIWALRELEDGHGDLIRGLELLLHTHKLCSTATLELTHTGPNLHKLPRLAVTSLLLITQEAITNAVRHGSATKVTVQVENSPDKIILKILDNGVGFDMKLMKSAATGQYGLDSMRNRMARIGGSLNIVSTPGGGACVEASVDHKNLARVKSDKLTC